MKCIWHMDESLEFDKAHIIPEALGCPEELIFSNGEECKPCNNGLADLDQALIHSLDFAPFLAGQLRKKNRPPVITGRSNLFASWEAAGPVIEVNFGPGKVRTASGRILSAPAGKPNAARGHIDVVPPEAEVTFRMPVLHHPKLSRAIHKVALASLVKLISHDQVLQPAYDPVRKFVRNGTGFREVLALSPADLYYRHQVGPVYSSQDGFHVLHLMLCGFIFLVDLSPTQAVVPKLKEQLKVIYGDEGWTWIPAN